MTTLFISDLHLEESRPDITNAFLGFLEEKVRGVEQLYILGDFFEAWIGDDERTPLQEQIASALRAVSDSGTRLFLMHGNRDFLIGKDYCNRVGATLLDDPTVGLTYRSGFDWPTRSTDPIKICLAAESDTSH